MSRHVLAAASPPLTPHDLLLSTRHPMSLTDMPDVLIQLIQHGLRSLDRVALALCCHRTLRLSSCAFAWKFASPPLRLRLKTRIPASPLFRFAPLVVHWPDRRGVPLSRATTALLDFSRRSNIVDLRILLEHALSFPLAQRVFLHPCMQAIHTVVLQESTDEQLRLCLALPELSALHCGSAFQSDKTAQLFKQAKALTSLSVRDLESITQLRGTRIAPLLQFSRLRRLSLTLPKYSLAMFKGAIVSDGLEELRLCNIAERNVEDCCNAFLALRSLTILTLDTIRDRLLDSILDQAHWAPALRQLIIVRPADRNSPSASNLVRLIKAAPALHCELQVPAEQLASIRESLFLEQCHAQLQPDEQLRLAVTAIREYNVGS